MNYNNLAERTNFIAGSPAFEHIPFFLTSVNIPEISLDHPEVSGGRFSHNIKLPGDTIKYGVLAFEMMIDEDLLIYDELYRLVEKNTNPETNTFGDFSFDFFVEVNDNKGHSVIVFNFENCRINSIGSLFLETSDDSTFYRVNVDIQFDRFYPVRQRRFELSGEYSKLREREPKIVSEEWISGFNLEDYVRWGLPKPEKIHNTDLEDIISMVSLSSESGLVSKFGFNPEEPFEIKVLVGSSRTIRFGITEGAGIQSNVNGRTGKSLVEIIPQEPGEYLIKWIPGEIQTSHTEVFLYFQGLAGSEVLGIEYRI